MNYVARVVVAPPFANVYAPYAHKDVIKTIPGRQWLPAPDRCWQVGVEYVDEVADVLRVCGCQVFVTTRSGEPWMSGRANVGHRSDPGKDWAGNLMDAVGPHRQEATFRSLAKVLHPDVGGDTRLMRELIAAREARRGGQR